MRIEVVVDLLGVRLSRPIRLVLHWLGPTEGCLKGEDVGVPGAQVLPHCNPGSLLLASLLSKLRVVVRVVRMSDLRHQEREHSRCFRVVRLSVTVEEGVLSSAVAVEVAVQSQRALVCETGDELLGVVNRGVQHLARVLPSSVQVAACQTAAVVTVDDSVWVEHGDDLEDELVSELASFSVVADQKVNGSLHHERGVGLTWVDPCADNHPLLLSVLLNGHSVGNRQVLTLVASYGSTQSVSRNVIQLLCLDGVEILCQVGVGVWLRV